MTVGKDRNTVHAKVVLAVQAACGMALLTAWLLLPPGRRNEVQARVLRQPLPPPVAFRYNEPFRMEPLYDVAEFVSDAELAAVLKKVAPRFDRVHMRPNYVEHAIRIWGARIEFQDPRLISGPRLLQFLTDSSKYVASWGNDAEPILLPSADGSGISVRWGSDRSASVHHDHLLASLTEAGTPLDTPVFTVRREQQFRDVLNQALLDYRPDERETEWSALAFGCWLAPSGVSQWKNAEGRLVSFDMLAQRLFRSHKRQGVCLGTHRVYSLVTLLRLDEQFGQQQQGIQLLSEDSLKGIESYLMQTRRLLTTAQAEDGSWSPDWAEGAESSAEADPEEKKKSRVISTGHHLEWLAVAPQKFHPDIQQIRRAARWAVQDVLETPQEIIDENYTFYSHVGNALALWRKTSPAQFWTEWSSRHPDWEIRTDEKFTGNSSSNARNSE